MPFTCDYCSSQFGRKDNLKRHGDCRISIKICESCGSILKSEGALQRHKMDKHPSSSRKRQTAAVVSMPVAKRARLDQQEGFFMSSGKSPETPQSNKITRYFNPTPIKLYWEKGMNMENKSGNSLSNGGNVNGYSCIGESGQKLPSKKKDLVTNTGLKKCFTALADKKQVNLELEVLQLMLRKEMQVPLETLDSELATILPYLLVHYIKTWPGWQRSAEYYEGHISFKNWYEKFNKFIMLKLSYVINDSFKEARNDNKSERLRLHEFKTATGKMINRNAQTDNLAPKGIAPFSIEISGPPVWLNSVVFSENSEGSVILKQHSLSEWDVKTIESITLKQIITWPHVSVHFLSNILTFTRSNKPFYDRQISIASNSFPTSNRSHVEEVTSILAQNKREVFTVDYIKHVANQLLEVLDSKEQEPKTLFHAFKTVIEEFLLDLQEINICIDKKLTVATNTSITFNIGHQAYFRNKKLSKGAPSRNDISYMELIIPRIQVLLHKVADSDQLTEYLNYLKTEKNLIANFSPEIRFSCNFCNVDFKQVNLLAQHIREQHKMEQPVLCILCKKNFFAPFLAHNRYMHACSGRK